MKKVVAGLVSVLLIGGSVITPSFAATKSNIVIAPESRAATEGLDDAILAAKAKISVPEELTEFSYNYIANNYEGTPYFRLTWRDKDYKSSIYVNCDTTGRILSYSINKYREENSNPKYLKSELKDTAYDFIKKMAPEVASHISFAEAAFNGVYDGGYTYYYERIENGIRMPDNMVAVSVDSESGEPIAISINWNYEVEIPSNEINVTIEQAREKIGENVKMELVYKNKEEKVNDKWVTKAFLVYVPDKGYVAIDAKNGNIYDKHDEYYRMSELANAKQMLSTNDMAADAGGFTEEEIKKIDELKGLISKEDAIKIISNEKSLLLDESAKAVTANLYQNYDYRNKEEKGYVWNLSFSDPREVNYETGDTYRAYADAKIDAKTGEILSYSSSVRDYYDENSEEWKNVNVKYSSEQCKDVFEDFVKKYEKEKFEQTVLSEEEDGYILKFDVETPVYGGYSYNYARTNEGIKYTYNNIRGQVDGVTGKIYGYNVNWDEDVVFESKNGAMSAEKAYEAYSSKEGFELVYEINNKHYLDDTKGQDEYYDYSEIYSLEKEVRLVYRTNIDPSFISPFTGEQLDYEGKPYEKENEKVYGDILGHWGERQIKLLTDLGATFEGNEFLPEKEITREEFNKLAKKMSLYPNEEEEKDEKEILTKTEFVKEVITLLYYKKIAELKGIYKVDFVDSNDIPDEDLGYVALAKGLGIISGDNSGRFNPNRNVTRAEAAVMLLNLVGKR